MRLYILLSVFLHTVSVLGTLQKRCASNHLSFVTSASHSARGYSFNNLKNNRKLQIKAAGTSTLPQATSSKTVVPAVPWDRTFLNIWKEHGSSIVLATVYGIRIFRFLLHIRSLLEWLPQANPYLFPFDAIYQTTNAYIKPFQTLIPPIHGVDISNIVAFFVLDRIEFLLAHKPGVAQVAL